MIDVATAAASARGPQPLWALVPAAGRARFMRRAAQLLLDELDPLAVWLARSTGVPRTEATLAELLPSVAGLRALADDGPAALADRRLGRSVALRRAAIVREPIGVIGIRAGTASPWAEPMLEAASAALAGNGVVLAAPTGERLVALLTRAGLPEGLVTAVDPDVGAEALREACDRIVETEPAGPKATMLVLENAPVGHVVHGALWAAFSRAGRAPAAVGRMVLVRDGAADLVPELAERAGRLRLGDPADPETEIGPLDSAEDAERVAALIDDAVAAGAELLCGGRTGERGFAPAVLRGVPAGARLLTEPVPGPVLAIVEAGDEAEAIAIARDAPAVSVWTDDRAHGERVARSLGAERTWVNDHGALSPAAPARMARHVEELQLHSAPSLLRAARWLPYDPVLVRAASAAARFIHGRESGRLGAARSGALPVARVAGRIARDALSGRR